MKLFGKKNKKLAKILPLILILLLIVVALIGVWAINIRQQTGGKAATQITGGYLRSPVACGGACGPKRCLANQVCKTGVKNGVRTYSCQNDSRCAGN